MSAPSADFPALGASTSSSGYTDGLGRRALAFDREGGTMLERLVVRAELSAFERSLRDRVERIGALDDERLARPRSIERGSDGALVVLSEFVPGSRLSDLLDAASQQGTVPGVDVALGFLLDVLPALCGLHGGAGFAHGAIGPGRTVLTPAGQVVLLDGIFGDALARLQYSRSRLWAEFAIAMPPSAGPVRFDAAADIAQVALSAVMLVIGRPVAEYEYPDAIPSLLVEVVDVAQIRGSGEFATALQRFLQRSLPIPGRRPYTDADDALIDVRDLARGIGMEVCRRALVEFIEQQESGGQSAASEMDAERHAGGEYGYGYEVTESSSANGDGEDDDVELEVELELDAPAEREEEEAPVYDLDTSSDYTEPAEPEPAAANLSDSLSESVPEVAAAPEFEPAPFASESFEEALREPEPVAIEPAPVADEPLEATSSFTDEPTAASDPEEPAPYVSPYDADAVAESPAEIESAASSDDSEPVTEEDADTDGDAAESESYGAHDLHETQESKSSRRRKRSRSARSRKDKLRSTARPEPLIPGPAFEPPPVAPPAPKPLHGGWHVEPSRPAAATPAAPPLPPPVEPPPVVLQAPPPPPPIAVQPVAPLAPPPPLMAPEPIVVAPPMPRPILVPPPAPPPIPVFRTPAAPPLPVASPTGTVKLKVEPPTGYAPPRKARIDPTEDFHGPRTLAPSTVAQPAPFPWKIASGAVVLLVVGLIAGRAYLTGGAPEKPGVPVEAEPVTAPPLPAAAPPAAAARTGRIQVETQPPGARVMLDGKLVGESPLNLEVPAGRHTLTLASLSGSVRRTVKVDAGKTVTVDVPIFSGWVDVVAPIILDVTENGKSIGTTENSRLLLQPGRHDLTFSNRDLDYSSSHTLDIEPGEVKTLTLDPRGTANLNASPWAEVWVDGKKVGETPLANLQLPLGTHEVVFKHPQFGDRRLTTTIRANAPVALSVDMSKPQ